MYYKLFEMSFMNEIFLSLLHGLTVGLEDDFDGRELYEMVVEVGILIINFGPHLDVVQIV